MKLKTKKPKRHFPREPTIMERVETYGNIELRYKNAELDEVVVVDESGKCLVPLEWMHDNSYWMGIYGTKKDISVNFESDSKIRFKVRR